MDFIRYSNGRIKFLCAIFFFKNPVHTTNCNNVGNSAQITSIVHKKLSFFFQFNMVIIAPETPAQCVFTNALGVKYAEFICVHPWLKFIYTK